MTRLIRSLLAATLLLVAALPAGAASREEIDASVSEAIQELYKFSSAAKDLAAKSSGMLVFPKATKAGIGIGGEYGEGALLVGGKTVNYYSVAGASIGLQLGAQSRAQLILFMTPKSLAGFRASKGWKAGVDGSVALVTIGAGGEVMTPDADDQAVLGFIYGAKGLMDNLSFEGQKFTKIKR